MARNLQIPEQDHSHHQGDEAQQRQPPSDAKKIAELIICRGNYQNIDRMSNGR